MDALAAAISLVALLGAGTGLLVQFAAFFDGHDPEIAYWWWA